MADDQTPGPVLVVAAAVAGFLAASYSQPAPPAIDAQPAAKGKLSAQPGAGATTPTQIPASGWWSVIKRTVVGFNDDRLMTEAAGVTFYTLLALFPAIATLISLYGLIADPATIATQLQSARGIVPSGGLDIIKGQVDALTSHGQQALGFGALIGLLASIWSANAGIKSLFDALNVVYHEREERGYVKRTLVCLCFTLGALVFLIAALTAIVVVPVVLKFLGLDGAASTLFAFLRWPALLVVLGLFLALVYRYGPSRARARWQWVSWGSAFAEVAWVAVSVGFSYYVANFGSYDKTYGSLGAAIGFLTWIWISTMVVLLGGELNAELEQQTSQDSTVGPEKPKGERGAFKADTKA